jgi:hypothetical protein
MPRLSVIFSFRNEEDNIRELVRRTRSVLDAEVRKNVLSSYELKNRPNDIIESSFAFAAAKEIRPPAQNESGQMEPGSRRAA